MGVISSRKILSKFLLEYLQKKNPLEKLQKKFPLRVQPHRKTLNYSLKIFRASRSYKRILFEAARRTGNFLAF